MTGKTANLDAAETIALGFLTVCEDKQQGYLGGYLLLNAVGRPLEFHCTAPVRPTAQEILYGPTLKPYLFAEQIGMALVRKAKQSAAAILTDVEAVAAIADLIEAPVGVVVGERLGASSDEPDSPEPLGDSSEACRAAPQGWAQLNLGDQCVAVRPGLRTTTSLADAWKNSGASFPVLEPFHRIRAALLEAAPRAR